MSLSQMRQKTAPLRDIIESFFRANYDLSPKTATWYRQNLEGFVAFVEQAQGREAILSDVDKGYVDAFLKERIAQPTCKYPKGSPFAARAASATLKRFANYLAAEGILADKFGISVLKHVRRTRVDDDVRQPLSDAQLERILDTAGRPGDRDRAVIVLLGGSGLRANEAREARVGDLDLDAGTFRVRPETSKFGRERVVYLHPAVGQGAGPVSPQPPARRESRLTPVPHPQRRAVRRGRLGQGLHPYQAPQRHPRLLRARPASHLGHQLHEGRGSEPARTEAAGRWERWEMVERYSHAVPVKDRRSLPNPLAPSHKTAFGQLPSARIISLRVIG